MLVAGLLVALRVGACPQGTTPIHSPDPNRNLCAHYDLPDPMTTEVLCSAATEDLRCCLVSTDENMAGSTVFYTSSCHAAFANKPGDPTQCGEEMTEFVDDGHTHWTMHCPWPPGEPAPPATDEGLNEAETGVIVVASVIAVAAVAGAVAVYRAGT